FNGSAAAIRAGYSEKTARFGAYQVLKHPEVQAYLNELIGKIQERNNLEVDELVQELKRIAFADIGDYYDDESEILPVKAIDKNARAALEQYENSISHTKYGVNRSRKIKLSSKLDALEKLMRYMGAYERDNKQRGELDITTKSTDDLVAELAAIRARRSLNEEEE